MSYSNGLLPEKYSYHESCGKGDKADPGVGFKLTDDSDYDIQNKRLVNVKQGTDDDDVVVKTQLDKNLHYWIKQLLESLSTIK